MPTDPDRASESVVYGRLALRASHRNETWLDRDVFKATVLSRTFRSEGCTSQSDEIDSRLASALADTWDAESESPRRIRMSSSPLLGAARMDPWVEKNERRLRLVEKKHAEGLSPRESLELIRLKREVYEHLQSVDPRPADLLDRIDSRLDALKDKLEAKRGSKV